MSATELNQSVLDQIREGNTLEAMKLLFGRASAQATGVVAINRALFGTHRPGQTEAIDQAVERHLALLESSSPEQRDTVLYNLGCFALFRDEVLDAHYYFTEAVHARSDHLAARHNLGYTFELMAETDNARREYEAVLAQDPGFVISRVNLAQLDIAEGDVERALETLRELRRGRPTNLGITLYLCRALLQRGTIADAKEVLTLLASTAKWQTYQDLRECRAYAKFLSGDADGAEADFREMLSDEATSLFAVAGLVKICAARKDWDAMQSFAEQYHALNPTEAARRLLAAYTDNPA
ncbi:MAG: tetratricopeptide repeat protein [Candidatus Lambdaproteobacteria bacterium]|nr:tetratricopeptide repeat protein [Candidatus Lambdaproteobacteria bacterium]